MTEQINKLRGEHCLNVFVSYELKEKIQKLALKYDRTMADVVRSLIKVGIPIMEGITEAEQKMLNEYLALFRKLRKVKQMGIKEQGYEKDILDTKLRVESEE